MKKQSQQVPDELAEIILEERLRLDQERSVKEQTDQSLEKERLDGIKRAWRNFLKEVKPLVPEMLHRYIVRSSTEDQWRQRSIKFRIPGLAPFRADFNIQEGDSYALTEFYVPGVDDGDPEELPTFRWNLGQRFNPVALSGALLYAENAYSKYKAVLQERAKQELERRRSIKENERLNQQNEKKAAKKVERQLTEEEKLFDAVKSDPIVLTLIKAIVLVQQERANFVSEIENANWSAENIENRLSEKLAQAKRQTDDARREVEDERRRKEDLQDELDKAEKKAKRF